jgi:hypothetical protein
MTGVTEVIARTEERRYPRGAVVVVDDDGCRFEARIVAVIGVVAVVGYRPEHVAGEACRAVPVRCCRPVSDEPPGRRGDAGTP